MLKAVLFDLDGTLLPMDQDEFVKVYFKNLAVKLAPYGYDPKALIKGVWEGTEAMIANDGSVTNEQRFWARFAALLGDRVRGDMDKLDDYYRNEFEKAREVCGFNPKAKQVVDALNKAGVKLALATNPIFPAIATQKRMSWAGVCPSDFELYTTYENIGYCKPNLDYYRQILDKLGVKPEEALMVGNDVSDDMVARNLGMQVFLLTDCLINKDNEDITKYPHGGFDELMEYVTNK